MQKGEGRKEKVAGQMEEPREASGVCAVSAAFFFEWFADGQQKRKAAETARTPGASRDLLVNWRGSGLTMVERAVKFESPPSWAETCVSRTQPC
jgi:hypothetical protein